MQVGVILLVLAYVLSQFFRSFLSVMTEVLGTDIGATPADLSSALGIWFLIFAAMQIPVGEALDRVGPRLTASVLFLFGAAGGSMVFAFASAPWHITVAMALIGVGCSPVLMASYYIFARMYPAHLFATLAAVVIGVGSLGNLASSIPMGYAVNAFGWRETMGMLGAASALIAVATFLFIQDPPKVEQTRKGSVFDLLKMPVLWVIFPLMLVNYAPSAGLRGLWIAPYLSEVHQVDRHTIELGGLIMAFGMVIGTFAYGPLDRIFGTRKWVVFTGNALTFVALLVLALIPTQTVWSVIAIFTAIGFFGTSFPMMMAHARGFFPEHLVGRGVTLMNLFGIGGVGVFQYVTGQIYSSGASLDAVDRFGNIFWLYALIAGTGVLIYAFSKDNMN